MKALCAICFATLLATVAPAMADSPQLPPDQASMLVSGAITVDTDGKVVDYTLDQADKLPSSVVTLLARTVPVWRFEPVLRDGKPVMVKSNMHLRIIARPVDGGNYALSVGSSWFHGDNTDNVLSAKDRKPPSYPRAAIRERVSGTVYLVAEIDNRGHVDKLATEQVNLHASGSDRQMKRWREMLAKASTKAVREWTFSTPSTGSEAAQDHWIRRIPIDFQLFPYPPGRQHASNYGKWISYIPGPRNHVDWLTRDDVSRNDVDALPPGGNYAAKQELHLIRNPST